MLKIVKIKSIIKKEFLKKQKVYRKVTSLKDKYLKHPVLM